MSVDGRGRHVRELIGCADCLEHLELQRRQHAHLGVVALQFCPHNSVAVVWVGQSLATHHCETLADFQLLHARYLHACEVQSAREAAASAAH
jgi:hypothetical protein